MNTTHTTATVMDLDAPRLSRPRCTHGLPRCIEPALPGIGACPAHAAPVRAAA